MNRNLTALKEVAAFLKGRNLKYALIGGLAVGCRGQARFTKDVDISCWVDLGDELAFINAVLEKFSARMEDAAAFAISFRTLVIEASNGVPIDLALACFPFEEEMLSRATSVKIQAGLAINVLTAEDLILTKAMAGRSQDWIDIQGIYDRCGPDLDNAAIESRVLAVAELIDTDEILTRLQECREKAEE